MVNNTLRLKLKTPVISNPILRLKTFTVEPKVTKPKTKQMQKVKPSISKKEKQLLTPDIYLMILSHFQTKYSKCFSNPVKPLAIGIIKDMLKERIELEISGIKIRKFCYVYCNTPEYKALLKQGTSRVDLFGNPTGIVEKTNVNISKK
jgi:hypothetical protein